MHDTWGEKVLNFIQKLVNWVSTTSKKTESESYKEQLLFFKPDELKSEESSKPSPGYMKNKNV